jgi:hypothetical protein
MGTVLAGMALGGLSVPVIIVGLLAVDPIGGAGPGPGAVAAFAPPAAVRPPAAPQDPLVPQDPQDPPVSGSATAPARRLDAGDAGDAAAIVGRRFSGAEIVQAELERERGVLTWELTFLHNGGEYEITMNATPGAFSDHDIEDDDDDDDD